MQSYDTLIEKWSPVLNENSAGSITDHHRRAVTAVVLENQERALREQRSQERGFLTEDAPGNATSSIGTWDPVLISLVRRAMPNLIAYDVAGVQPMTGPTGLIFAMKARYGSGVSTAREALFNEQKPDSLVTQLALMIQITYLVLKVLLMVMVMELSLIVISAHNIMLAVCQHLRVSNLVQLAKLLFHKWDSPLRNKQ